MSYVALLDTNAIWPFALRDTILRAAERKLFSPSWSQQILDELVRSLTLKRPDLTAKQIQHLVSEMTIHFPEALVENYQDLIPVMRNHEEDRHVLAAAVRKGAAVVVTNNVTHFPPEACEAYNIDIQTPDEFLCHLWHLSPEEMADILVQQAADLRYPPCTVDDVLEVLGRSVPRFAQTALESGLLD